MPAKRTKKPLNVVGKVGTPQSVIEILREALARAERDETLAIAVIEVRHGAEIKYHWAGDDGGFGHQLYAGAGYLQRALEDGE